MTAAPVKRRILIVEDDPDTRQLLTMGLGRAGWEVAAAEDGEKAIAALAAPSPNVVLIDLMMPRMDGVRLLRWIREEAKLTLPAVVFSSSNTPELVAQVAALGATFLVKPVRLPALLAALEKVTS